MQEGAGRSRRLPRNGLHQVWNLRAVAVSLPLNAVLVVLEVDHSDRQMRQRDLAVEPAGRRYADVVVLHCQELLLRRSLRGQRCWQSSRDPSACPRRAPTAEDGSSAAGVFARRCVVPGHRREAWSVARRLPSADRPMAWLPAFDSKRPVANDRLPPRLPLNLPHPLAAEIHAAYRTKELASRSAELVNSPRDPGGRSQVAVAAIAPQGGSYQSGPTGAIWTMGGAPGAPSPLLQANVK